MSEATSPGVRHPPTTTTTSTGRPPPATRDQIEGARGTEPNSTTQAVPHFNSPFRRFISSGETEPPLPPSLSVARRSLSLNIFWSILDPSSPSFNHPQCRRTCLYAPGNQVQVLITLQASQVKGPEGRRRSGRFEGWVSDDAVSRMLGGEVWDQGCAEDVWWP